MESGVRGLKASTGMSEVGSGRIPVLKESGSGQNDVSNPPEGGVPTTMGGIVPGGMRDASMGVVARGYKGG